jgi:hypothetical protein
MTRESGTKEQCYEQLLLGKAIKADGWLEQIRIAAMEHAAILKAARARVVREGAATEIPVDQRDTSGSGGPG